MPPDQLEIPRNPEPERLDAFQVFLRIRKSREEGKPFSLIRLGSGEAALLGWPEVASMQEVAATMSSNWFDRPTWKWQVTNLFKAVRDRKLHPIRRAVLDLAHRGRQYGAGHGPPRIRIGFTPRHTMKPRTVWDEKDVAALSDALRRSVANADIVGVPGREDADPMSATIGTSLTRFSLLAESASLTHANVNRFLNDALLYRPMLEKLDFVGIISSRDIEERMKRVFGIGEVRQYKVRSEPWFPNNVPMRHYPERFNELRETLEVPYAGALFLVGAGVFGKMYCDWIKRRGGVAVDAGSLFDAWAGFGRVISRTSRLDAYGMYRRIGRMEAVGRHNAIMDHEGSGGPRADPDSGYLGDLPDRW